MENGKVTPEYRLTTEMVANALTKSLARDRHHMLVKKINLETLNLHLRSGCVRNKSERVTNKEKTGKLSGSWSNGARSLDNCLRSIGSAGNMA